MNLQTTLNVAEIIRAAQSTARVAYLTIDGDVLYGTARSIHESRESDDVRDAHLRVTLDQGVEMHWNVGVLATKYEAGTFAINPSE